MVTGEGSTEQLLTSEQAQLLLQEALDPLPLEGKRVLVIVPDGTRTAPTPLLFWLLYRQIGHRVAKLDYLIALGDHPPMDSEAIDRLVGVSPAEQAECYPKVRIFNHHYDLPKALETIGVIPARETGWLTGGLLVEEIPVKLNRTALDYDQLVICGPVFPHELAGFSGGAEGLFPGIAGPEMIDAVNWLGAMGTSMNTIGQRYTPVRRVIHRAAEFVPRPILSIDLVLQGSALRGMYIGRHEETFGAAADLSAHLNVITVPRAFRRVLCMPSEMYGDLWTATRALTTTEPATADGGEVIVYAPHITELSHVHERLIDRVGYHVRDYFLKQPDRFRHLPGTIKAHSSLLKGSGSYDPETGIETPRIQVTLATGIPEERCQRLNLAYMDHRTIDPDAWVDKESDGLLLVLYAGEMLYRALDLQPSA